MPDVSCQHVLQAAACRGMGRRLRLMRTNFHEEELISLSRISMQTEELITERRVSESS